MWLSKYLEVLVSSPLLTTAFTLVLAYWAILMINGLKGLITGGLWEFWSQGKVKDKYGTWLYTKIFSKEITEVLLHTVPAGFGRYYVKDTSTDEYWTGADWSVYSFEGKEYLSEENAEADFDNILSTRIYDKYTPAYVLLPTFLIPIAYVADWLLFNAPMQTLLVLTIAAVVAIIMFGGRYMYSFSEKVAKLDEATKKLE